METVIDLFSARPGERFRFRMIGRPKAWFRFYLEEGTVVDCESDIDGVNSYRAFGSFAMDREGDRLSMVIMPYDLATRLASNFKILGVNPGNEIAVDVDIAITDSQQRYFIDIGKVSELPNPEIIERINELWNSGIVEFSLPEGVDRDSVREWTVPEWHTIDLDSVEDIEHGNELDILVSFLLRAVDTKDEDTSLMASRILRIIRIKENGQK